MKPIKFDMGRYNLFRVGTELFEGFVTGQCTECGNDIGKEVPMMKVDEVYINITVCCPSCGNVHNLWNGTGAKQKCEPKSSQVNTSADF